MHPEKRILVVGDDAATRTLLQTVLRKRSWAADVARDGLEASEKLASCRHALRLVDLTMPRRSGHDLLELLGRMSQGLRPMVVVLAAGGTPRGLDPQVVLVRKPLDINLLLDTVTGCLAAVDGQTRLDGCLDRTPPRNALDDDTN